MSRLRITFAALTIFVMTSAGPAAAENVLRFTGISGGAVTMDPQRVLREWFSPNIWNVSGYANPRVDELIEKIKTEMVTYGRDAYLEEALCIVADDLVYLPIRHGVSVYAMRQDLEIPPDPWNVPRFRLARFQKTGG
jgi:ABC-type transport system substrate-binding protein